jgi:acetoin utilization deacetylase AcuC-like enzyme
MSMLVIHDPRCAEFGSLTRPENATRVRRSAEHLRQEFPAWAWQSQLAAVPDETLLLAHRRSHLDRLKAPEDFDADTPFVPGISDHARRAVAAALAASAHAVNGGGPAFSLMRPPGHHATSGQAMGFCYLNQIAVAALAARRDPRVGRVAIWDFDAHHGNGTEEILQGREGFLFCSVHQSPCYPGTGLRDFGNIRNWPVPPRAPRPDHLAALRASLDAVCAFRPDLILVSAGFDAYAGDPLTEMTLEAEDFAQLGQWLQEAGIPAAAVLEGGYSPELPQLVAAFLRTWVG